MKFSVVVPAFNASCTIRRAVESVWGQLYQASELIIVDDGSEDETVTTIRGLMNRNPWPEIRLISLKERGGPSRARNIGWDASSGDYVAFLDADDEWMREKLLVQEKILRETGAILLGTTYPSLNRVQVPVTGISKQTILFRNPFWTPTVVIKRSIPERFCENLWRCEDHLLFAMVTIKYDRSYYFSQRIIHEHKWPFGEGGLSRSLLAMQAGNWRMYTILRREGYVGFLGWCGLEVLATMKFAVRPIRLLARKKGLHLCGGKEVE